MAQQGKAPERERRDWSIILILLLFGFLCMIIAGERAIRFAPNWRLNANMRSNIDPNSDFLTNRPVSFLEPLDSSILTQPAWINVFLTPGASFQTSIPVTPMPTSTPLATNTPLTPNPTISTAIISPTSTFAIPTNTVFIPPPPLTNTPVPPSTPLPQVDLQITKSDGVTTYIENGATTYTIVVTNAGPNSVNGATVVDNFPSQIAAANWTCAPSGGATCTANGSGNINQSVNLPVSSTVTYTVSATIGSGVSGDMVNSATISLPAGYADPDTGNNSATDTNTFLPSADLRITKTDNSTAYAASAVKTYIIVVSNAGPSNVTGATVTDTFPANITSASWTCSGTGGATCTGGPVSGNINDTVNIPAGQSVTYTVTANISGTPSGDLVNTATVSSPIYDPNNANNSVTDTDTLITPVTPPTEVGSTPDNNTYTLGTGSSLTLSVVLVANGDAAYDLIYYELDNMPDIFMDNVIIEISDGSDWYTIFNWGDGNPDTNSNIAVPLAQTTPFTTCIGEPDNCLLDPNLLIDGGIGSGTGIGIDIDSVAPTGRTYYYIRFTAPAGDTGNDGMEIDAIQILP